MNNLSGSAKAEIYLAGGCFWGTQHYFDLLSGVLQTEVGYANGKTENPTYEQVKYENTGHAETVKIIYDPEIICLEELLQLYYKAIDPTSVNRQGGDIGTQYRTGIYYIDLADEPRVKASLTALQEQYSEPVMVEALPLSNFYTAEEYHQKYLIKNPDGYCHLSLALFEAVKNYCPSGKDR
ncbi:MAG: peptide-methionine (S)-S-oxide reductase MsrA [Lachnospiraceae bacterium]|nr:peptide-methionine (S)-S-oxide reductase MsrA [Lachnospiraceae bacterium]